MKRSRFPPRLQCSCSTHRVFSLLLLAAWAVVGKGRPGLTSRREGGSYALRRQLPGKPESH